MGGTRGGVDNPEQRVLGSSLCLFFHLCSLLSGMAFPELGVCLPHLAGPRGRKMLLLKLFP